VLPRLIVNKLPKLHHQGTFRRYPRQFRAEACLSFAGLPPSWTLYHILLSATVRSEVRQAVLSRFHDIHRPS
jgi:hypothetical protein